MIKLKKNSAEIVVSDRFKKWGLGEKVHRKCQSECKTQVGMAPQCAASNVVADVHKKTHGDSDCQTAEVAAGDVEGMNDAESKAAVTKRKKEAKMVNKLGSIDLCTRVQLW